MRLSADIRFVDLLGEIDFGETIRQQARAGVLDGAWIYEDANYWQGVETDKAYGLTDLCTSTLRKLAGTPHWAELATEIAGLIDLGTGSGIKTCELAGSIQNHGRDDCRSALVDINRDLLAQAAFRLAALGIGERPPVLACRAQFDHLQEIIRAHRWGSVGCTAFSILGNTIANLPEDGTLQLLSSATRKRDILIVSLELASADGIRNSADDVLRHYDKSEYVKKLFSAPLKHLPGAAPIQIGLCSGVSRYSRLPGTISVFAHTKFEGRPVSIIHSNRYDQDEFSALLAEYGFRLILASWRVETPLYRYLVFERV